VAKKKNIEMSNDEIQELILKYLYEIHKKARSLKNTGKKISEIKKDLKKYGLKDSDIIPNLDYLIQTGWVKVEKEETEIQTPRGFKKSQKTEYFKISDVGINYFEGSSKFQRVEKSYAGINITNIQGVVTLGDNNVIVNKTYSDLYRELSLLSEMIRKNNQLSDEDKLNYTSEIETIKAQLSKTEPDRDIIAKAWNRLKPLATVAGISSFFEKVGKIIGGLIHG